MASITNDGITIEGITQKYLLMDFSMNIEPNDHGHAKMKLRMVDDGKGEKLLENMENRMVTIKSSVKDNTGILFKGYMESCTVCPQLDGETVEIGLVTATIKADAKRRSCSFQRKDIKYADIINKTASECGGVCAFFDDRIKGEAIEKPVIRYKETEWEFIKRISSRYHLQIVPDETADKPAFTTGIKEEGTAQERAFFAKEYKNFIECGLYIERKLRDSESTVSADDYKGMEVRSFKNLHIGMGTSYRGKNMVICAKRAEMEGAEIVFTYVLGSKELYAPDMIYNWNLHGRCLEGKVVKCENETVKLQLDIDTESGNTKAEGELYKFNWQPETGNLMYCMPEKDTVVSLYVGGTDEGEAIVINSLRKDKGRDIDKPDRRYLTSIDKKRMFLKKKEIGFSMEDIDDGKTHFRLDDDKGSIFQTDKKMVIQADGEINMTGDKVDISAKKEVKVLNGTTNVQIKNKINIKGKMTYLGFGATAPEQQEKAEKLELKKKEREGIKIVNTGKSTSGKLLSGAAKEANEKFRGDRFKPEDSFNASVGEPKRSEMVKANAKVTCPLGHNLDGGYKDNKEFISKLSDEEKKCIHELTEMRKNTDEVDSDTILQKVISEDVFLQYTKADGGKTTISGCTAKASDAAPYTELRKKPDEMKERLSAGMVEKE